jgi:hypothetical protein
MKKIFSFLLGGAIYLGLALILSSYGNMVVHPGINEAILYRFDQKFISTIAVPEKFKNYGFVMHGTLGMKGFMIDGYGWTDIHESEVSLSMSDWIKHGGLSADEPEIAASFRHFYDPVEPPSKRYLQNIHNGYWQNFPKMLNPKVNHIDWGISDPEHTYNWENGKISVQRALTSDDISSRERDMGFAWRALGETLHLIADMGLPAHVRDDAHPALLQDAAVIKYFGDPDPYEEICNNLAESMVEWGKTGKVDPDLKEKFAKAKTAKEIAEILAVYTNQNFFTNETISGSQVVSRIHPEKTYETPKLDACTYDELDNTYHKTISGYDVIMCRDRSFFQGLFSGYIPYIDKMATASQAQVLMPQIAEAGAHVMKLFIPQLTVTVKTLSTNKITGEVKHKTDEEYTVEIKYNGPVLLLNSKSKNKVGEVKCENGVIDAEINLSGMKIDWSKGEKLIAQIGFGDIYVNSDEAVPVVDYEYCDITISNGTNPFSMNPSGTITYFGASGRGLEWKGSSFELNKKDSTIVNEYTSRVYESHITGQMSSDMKVLQNVVAVYLEKQYFTGYYMEYSKETEIRLSQMPMNDLVDGIDTFEKGVSGWYRGSDVSKYLTGYSYKKSVREDNGTYSTSSLYPIDMTDSNLSLSFKLGND